MLRPQDFKPYLPELVWHFLAAFLPFSLALALFLYAYISVEKNRALGTISSNESIRIEASRNGSLAALTDAITDIQQLARDPALLSWLEDGGGTLEAEVTNQFLMIAKTKRVYDQVRVLGLDGMERIRVNYARGQASAVPGYELQNKSNRYYFSESVDLEKGRVFISPLDLNVEGDVIERPFKPMIRMAAPIFNGRGERKGVVVLNYLAQHLLDRMSETASGIDGDLMLVNGDGFWLLSPRHEDEWGFQLGTGRRFSTAHAEAWKNIMDGATQFRTEKGLYTVAALRPTTSVDAQNKTAPVLVGGSAPSTYIWWLVSYVPEGRLRILLSTETKMQIAYAFVLLLIAVLSLSYSAMRVARLHSDENLKQAAKVMEVTRDGVLIIAPSRCILSANQAACDITGYLPGELPGMSEQTLHAHQEDVERDEAIWRHIEDHGMWQGEIWCRRKNGEAFTAHVTLSRICDRRGRLQNYIMIFSDITDRKLEEQALLKLAYHDPLTGLPNRALFLDRLEVALASAKRSGRKAAALFIDLDKFKPVNDALGHEAGDSLLIETAKRLQSVLREADTVARFGGDEFLVLLPDIEYDHDALAVAGTLVERVKEPFTIKGHECRIGCSIGVALFPVDADMPAKLVEKADLAMYQAKQAGDGSIRMAGRELPDHPVPARRYLRPVN